mmetsp:Transcript_14047/g.33993  ORF Transcript_14047/g.33993 Transcript_14047/m.33993 type:complete len:244 (-) Transcript_14047:518-1249(-)
MGSGVPTRLNASASPPSIAAMVASASASAISFAARSALRSATSAATLSESCAAASAAASVSRVARSSASTSALACKFAAIFSRSCCIWDMSPRADEISRLRFCVSDSAASLRRCCICSNISSRAASMDCRDASSALMRVSSASYPVEVAICVVRSAMRDLSAASAAASVASRFTCNCSSESRRSNVSRSVAASARAASTSRTVSEPALAVLETADATVVVSCKLFFGRFEDEGSMRYTRSASF